MEDSWRGLMQAAGVLLGVLLMGTLGFHFIEEWSFFDSFYMSLITITTIGYSETHPLSQGGKLFNSLIIMLGVSTFTFAVSRVVQGLVKRELATYFRSRNMHKTVKKMEDHFIVCGAGRVGSRIARRLAESNVNYLVIDQSISALEHLEDIHAPYVHGCATEEGVLRKAGLTRAKGLVTAIGSDADNVYISLMARDINPEVTIVARANSAEAEPRLRQAGANRVISPDRLGSQQMADALLKPTVIDFFDDIMAKSGIEMDAIVVHHGSALAGVTLKEAQLAVRFGINVIRVRKANGDTLNSPSGSTKIEGGDHLVVVGGTQSIERLNRLCLVS